MNRSDLGPIAGNVTSIEVASSALDRARFQRRLCGLQSAFHRGDRVVDRFSRSGTFRRGKHADRAANLRNLAVSPEIGDSHVPQRLHASGSIRIGREALLKIRE